MGPEQEIGVRRRGGAGPFHVGGIPGRLQFLSSRFRNGEVVAVKFGG